MTAAAFLGLAPTALAADAPATFVVSDLQFTRPSTWTAVKTESPMRKAQLSVPAGKAGTEAGEVIFFHFGPSNGGGTQANVDRWYRQFQGSRDQIKARTEDGRAGALKVTYVHAEGTYLSGMPGGPQTPKPGFALLGAIVEAAGGHIFVKFTGPKDVVADGAAGFKKMVETASVR